MNIQSGRKYRFVALSAAFIAAALLLPHAAKAETAKADAACIYNEHRVSFDAKSPCPFTQAQKTVIHEIAQLIDENVQKCHLSADRSANDENRWGHISERRQFACILKESPEAARKIAILEKSKQMKVYMQDPFISALAVYEAGANGGRCKEKWRQFEASIAEKDLIGSFGRWAQKKAPKFIARKYDISAADQTGLRVLIDKIWSRDDKKPEEMCHYVEEAVWDSNPRPNRQPLIVFSFASYHAVISPEEDPEMP